MLTSFASLQKSCDLQLACKASTIRSKTNSFFYNLDAKVSKAKFIKTKKLQENKFLKKIYERHPPLRHCSEALSFTNCYSGLLTFTHTHSPLLTNPLSALARRLTHESHNCKKLRRFTLIKFSIEIFEEMFFLEKVEKNGDFVLM